MIPSRRLALLVALLALGGCRRHVATSPASQGTAPTSQPAIQPATTKAPSAAVKVIYPSAPGSFVKLIERSRRGVVHLRGEHPARGGPAQWFAATANTPTSALNTATAVKLQRALGTGFLVDSRGLILTNAHLLADHKKIWARFFDGHEAPVRLVGYDARIDVALLSVDPRRLGPARPLRLGHSHSLRTGEWLVALGNPFGLQIHATVGIVSSRPRHDLPLAARGLWGHLQTDLRVHAGNSGGPVLSMLGDVIGIATATREATSGVGFVLPADTLRRVLPLLEKKGKVARPWLGLYIDKLDEKRAKLAGRPNAQGALVTSVLPKGPAARGGLRRGDIIVSFAKKPIHAASELPWLASIAGIGKDVEVVVWRSGATHRFSVKTEAMPE
ncbi:MAG: trypsin-like peptidase domain-containing protein [Deltaproteobacteria bacterium]|nr:trypsin-like peptidase domain-containing protein [Deltaproteobacteria bacterium]